VSGRVNLTNNAVVDIGLLQTFAEAINDHDERLTQLTNNITSSVSASIFDFSRDLIVSGVANIILTGGNGTDTITTGYTFSEPPLIVATASLINTSTASWAVTVSAITKTNFSCRVERNYKLADTDATSTINIQWIALGVKS
jgi:hypothetical protein